MEEVVKDETLNTIYLSDKIINIWIAAAASFDGILYNSPFGMNDVLIKYYKLSLHPNYDIFANSKNNADTMAAKKKVIIDTLTEIKKNGSENYSIEFSDEDYKKFNDEYDFPTVNAIGAKLQTLNNDEGEILISDFDAKSHKVVLWQELGIIEYLTEKYPVLENNNTGLANVFAAITGTNDKKEISKIRDNLKNLNVGTNKNIRNEKSLTAVKKILLELGLISI